MKLENKLAIDSKSLPAICLVDWYKTRIKYPLAHKKSGSYFGPNSFPGFVYVIKNTLNDLYKIGITTNLKNRIRSLTTQSGCELMVVLYIELHYDYDESPSTIEKELHTYFKNKRTLGEWFTLDVKDLIRIRQLFWHIEGEWIEDNIKEVLSNSSRLKD